MGRVYFGLLCLLWSFGWVPVSSIPLNPVLLHLNCFHNSDGYFDLKPGIRRAGSSPYGRKSGRSIGWPTSWGEGEGALPFLWVGGLAAES